MSIFRRWFKRAQPSAPQRTWQRAPLRPTAELEQWRDSLPDDLRRRLADDSPELLAAAYGLWMGWAPAERNVRLGRVCDLRDAEVFTAPPVDPDDVGPEWYKGIHYSGSYPLTPEAEAYFERLVQALRRPARWRRLREMAHLLVTSTA